jgi:hypothetical protein
MPISRIVSLQKESIYWPFWKAPTGWLALETLRMC